MELLPHDTKLRFSIDTFPAHFCWAAWIVCLPCLYFSGPVYLCVFESGFREKMCPRGQVYDKYDNIRIPIARISYRKIVIVVWQWYQVCSNYSNWIILIIWSHGVIKNEVSEPPPLNWTITKMHCITYYKFIHCISRTSGGQACTQDVALMLSCSTMWKPGVVSMDTFFMNIDLGKLVVLYSASSSPVSYLSILAIWYFTV